MESLLVTLAVLVLAGALIWRMATPPPSLHERFTQWAQMNGVIVTKSERRYIFAGPFFWERSGVVYKIEVEGPNGQTRTGWLRFGYDFFSRQGWSERVVWDEKRSQRINDQKGRADDR